jgi:hypothetical protein
MEMHALLTDAKKINFSLKSLIPSSLLLVLGDSSTRHPVQPLSPPSLEQTSGDGAGNWLYTVNTRTALLATAQNISQPNPDRTMYSAVGFIVKVTTADNRDQYRWHVSENTSKCIQAQSIQVDMVYHTIIDYAVK